MSATRAAWRHARSTAQRAVGAKSRGVLEDERSRPSDGPRAASAAATAAGSTPGASIDAAARSRGTEGRAAAVLGGEAKAALLLGRQRGRRLDGARSGARARAWTTAPGAVGCEQVRADLVDARPFGGVPAGVAGVRRGRGDAAVDGSVMARGYRARLGAMARSTPGRGDAPWKRKNPGDDLFSRKAALSVSSALESLTSVFGMGTGMASPLESPGFVASGRVRQRAARIRLGSRRGAED